MEQRDFFISYTKTDEDWAVWIAKVLISHGYTVYVQKLDILPGDNFVEKMNAFLKNSRGFLAVWSKAYSESRYCMAELQAAFHQFYDGQKNCLLPVRIDEHPIEPLYSALVHVDLSNMDTTSETILIDAVYHHVFPSTLVTQAVTQNDVFQDSADALYQWGENYYNGYYGVVDYAKARMYYEQAVDMGNTAAFFKLGYLYYKGLGVEQDYEKAREYYEQAAQQDDDERALILLGGLYEYGLGVNIDYTKAREYYEQATEKDSDSAMLHLGLFYARGLGVDQDTAKAREYFEQAAEQDNTMALRILGHYYEHGWGVDIDYIKAREYYKKTIKVCIEEGIDVATIKMIIDSLIRIVKLFLFEVFESFEKSDE